MKTKLRGWIFYTVLLAMVAAVAAPLATYALVNYPPGSLLQPGDVTGTEIRTGTITDTNISATAAISATKISSGPNDGTIPFSGNGAEATSSKLTYSTNTNTFSSLGSTTLGATTTVNGVQYVWPSTQGNANTKLQNNGAGSLAWVQASNSVTTIAYIAAETITAGDAVSVGDGQLDTQSPPSINTAGTGINSTVWGAYKLNNASFHANQIISVNITLINNGGGSPFAQPQFVLVADNSGSPSFNSLGTTTAGAVNMNGGVSHTYTINFATPITIQDNTVYWIVMSSAGQCDSNTCDFEVASTNTNGDKQSTNSGSTWSAENHDLVFGFTYTTSNSSDVYEANATTANFREKGFIGLAENSATAGQNVTVDVGGVSAATTSLAATTSYFLQNTNGQLGTSAGSVSRKIGISLGTSGFLVRPDNP